MPNLLDDINLQLDAIEALSLGVMDQAKPGSEEHIRVGPSPRLRSGGRTREVILAHWQD